MTKPVVEFPTGELTGQLQGQGAGDCGADRAWIGGGGRLPRAVLLGHQLDVGIRDVDSIGGDLGAQLVLLDGCNSALGQFVIGSEDCLHPRMGL